MEKEIFKQRKKALTELEYQYIDNSAEDLDHVTVEYLLEEVHEVLLSFPLDSDEQFLETAKMLLNLQILYKRLLTAAEANEILHSYFNPEMNAGD